MISIAACHEHLQILPPVFFLFCSVAGIRLRLQSVMFYSWNETRSSVNASRRSPPHYGEAFLHLAVA